MQYAPTEMPNMPSRMTLFMFKKGSWYFA